MDKRKTNYDKYGISRYRYNELLSFCRQYPEWKLYLANHKDTLKSKQITDMPTCHCNNQDETCDLAIKRTEIERKIRMIDLCAKEAGNDMENALILNVCYNKTYMQLYMNGKVYCSKDTFSQYRRYFFYLLSKEHRV